MSMEISADESLIAEFVAEGRDHLGLIEPDLLALEKSGKSVSGEVINRLFRAIHSVKGSAGFLGITPIMELGHAIESVLMKFRDGELSPEPENVDDLLAGVDKLRIMIDEIQSIESVPITDVVARLTEAPKAELVVTKDIPASDSLTAEFLAEFQEHLTAIEPDLLTLEKSGPHVGPEVVNRLFRAVHSIKGAAGFVGLGQVTDLCHVMESVLMNIRDGKLVPDPRTVDALLAGTDQFRIMVESIRNNETISVRDEIEGLEEILKNGDDTGPNAEVDQEDRGLSGGNGSDAVGRIGTRPDPRLIPEGKGDRSSLIPDLISLTVAGPFELGRLVFALDRGRLQEAMREEMTLHAVWIKEDRQTSVEDRDNLIAMAGTLGWVLASDLAGLEGDGTVLEASQPGFRHLFVATIVEEPQLVSGILEVPLEQVQSVDRETVRDRLDGMDQVGASDGGSGFPSGEKDGQNGLLRPEDERPLPVEPAGPDAGVGFQEDSEPVRPALGIESKDSRAFSGARDQAADTPPSVTGRRSAVPETLRVNVRLIDQMMNLAGELVLSRNQLRRLLEDRVEQTKGLAAVLQNVDLVTTDIQEQIMQLRMQPVGNIFNKFPRVVRDMSRLLAKEVELLWEGGEVELDKSILEALSDPLTHLIRNSIDHGLESPEERVKAGKPRTGRIRLKAFHEEGQVNLTVMDDGRGIDPNKVLTRALSSRLVDPVIAEKMSDQEKLALIFLPGISTAETVTDVSGRGVGMDVVRTNIEGIGGRLELESVLGGGTTVRLRLPLTLAIIPSLIVQACGHSFAIPQMDVQELVCVQENEVARRLEKVGDATVLRLRGRLLPLVRLADNLGLDRSFVHPASGVEVPDRREELVDRRAVSKPVQNGTGGSGVLDDDRRENDRRRLKQSDTFIVVLKVGTNRFGLVVDELLNTEEIVVKPLSSHIKECRTFSGTTIMGDGRVAMILSAGGIAATAQLRFGEVGAEERRRREEEERLRNLETVQTYPVVIFNYAPTEYFALPLSSVARLDKISLNSIKRIGNREFVNYRGNGLPLVRLEHFLDIGKFPADAIHAYLIIPRTGCNSAGIIASGVVDVVETAYPDKNLGDTDGPVVGSAVVDDKLTLFLDADELLKLASSGILKQTGYPGEEIIDARPDMEEDSFIEGDHCG